MFGAYAFDFAGASLMLENRVAINVCDEGIPEQEESAQVLFNACSTDSKKLVDRMKPK